MLTSLGVAALLGILGTVAAVLWTVVLRIGGAPGSALAVLGTLRERGGLIKAGVLLSFLIESYLLLAFAGMVIRFVQAFLRSHPHAPIVHTSRPPAARTDHDSRPMALRPPVRPKADERPSGPRWGRRS